jgi:molybdopterin converting factor small subunit
MAKVHFYAAARAAAGSSRLDVDSPDLGSLVALLERDNQKLRSVLPLCSYLLNGTSVTDLTTKLAENDQIDVLPRFAGG